MLSTGFTNTLFLKWFSLKRYYKRGSCGVTADMYDAGYHSCKLLQFVRLYFKIWPQNITEPFVLSEIVKCHNEI